MYVHIVYKNCVLVDRTLFGLDLNNQQLDGSTTSGRVNADIVKQSIMIKFGSKKTKDVNDLFNDALPNSLSQGHHLNDHRDDLREIDTLAAESTRD